METIGAIVAGVAVYVLCECLKEAWLQPLQEYKRIKAEISRLLVYYANIYTSPAIYSETDTERKKASQEFRLLASEVIAFSEVLYKHTQWGIPQKEVLHKTSEQLIGLSNRFYAPDIQTADRLTEHNIKSREIIQTLLKLNIK